MRKRFIDETLEPNLGATKLQNIRRNELKAMMFPIYSRASGCYQMDTFEQSDTLKDLHRELTASTRNQANKKVIEFQNRVKTDYPPYFLILIHVNTKKAYYVPMIHKDASTVKAAFVKYVLPNVPNIRQIVTDEDSAYTGHEMQELFKANNIKHVTTKDYGKHILGTINRFMRTLRDMNGANRNISITRMHQLIERYNDQIHRTTKHKPNEMNEHDEKQFIMDQYQKEQAIKAATLIPSNQPIRIALDQKLFEKRRLNFTQQAFNIERMDGKQYVIKDNDGEEVRVPRWKIKVGGVVESTDEPVKIIEWNETKNMYKVRLANNRLQYCSIKRLRKGNPYQAHPLEVEYWKDKEYSEMPPVVSAVLEKPRTTKIRLRVRR